MLSRYTTVNKEAYQHEINIQKSRFIAHIQRAENEAEAQEFIQYLKKKYWDATHNCSAYIIGEHDQIQKANDDGEPSGTAGVPILEVLKKRNLKDTVVVVTRYFGGTKLGAGGLIRAYGKATSEGLNAGGIVERRLVQIVQVTVDYTWIGKLEKELRASSYIIKEIHYLDKVIFEVYVEESEVQTFMNWVIELTNANCNFIKGDNVYLEENIKISKDIS
ncbi:YigZ family protein [Neobacillus niacini]|uniref:YigZ family protein n=1 Tax=Neobacillus niacini TaxID=86668 RepID=UPI003982F16A